jgi:hypothetical protein
VKRQVARVAAACDLSAFRYLAFPPVYFDPAPIASPEPVEALAEPPAETPPAAIVLAEPAAPLLPIAVEDMPAIRMPQPARHAEPPQRRFSMLHEIAHDPPPVMAECRGAMRPPIAQSPGPRHAPRTPSP